MICILLSNYCPVSFCSLPFSIERKIKKGHLHTVLFHQWDINYGDKQLKVLQLYKVIEQEKNATYKVFTELRHKVNAYYYIKKYFYWLNLRYVKFQN